MDETGSVSLTSEKVLNSRPSLKKSYDIAIVGCGLAGALAYHRIRSLLPQAQIAHFEAESIPGGRRRVGDFSRPLPYRGYGLNILSTQLLNFCFELHKQAHLDNQGLEEFFDQFHQPEIAFLTGGKLYKKKPEEELICEEVIKKLGGNSAGLQYKAYADNAGGSVESDGHAHPLSKYWSGNRKDAAVQIMEKILLYFGDTDVWNIHLSCFQQLTSHGISNQRLGDVNQLCRVLLQDYDSSLQDCFWGARVFNASLNSDNHWDLNVGGQSVTCQSLVCCQSPWEALKWLNKEHTPVEIVQLAAKVQPTSLVSVGTLLKPDADAGALPDVCFIISEDSQAIKTSHQEIVFRTAIPFEHSLQAPSVLKAIKSLKRAQKKYAAQYENLIDHSVEHVALLTSAWTVNQDSSARKYYERLEKQKFQSENLLFVGDSYGECISSDENIIKSLLAASGILSQRFGT